MMEDDCFVVTEAPPKGSTGWHEGSGIRLPLLHAAFRGDPIPRPPPPVPIPWWRRWWRKVVRRGSA